MGPSRNKGWNADKKGSKIAPLDPVRDRAWMKSNGLGVVAGEEFFQQAMAEFVQEADDQPLMEGERRYELKAKPSKGQRAILSEQWNACLHGSWAEVAMLAHDHRRSQENVSAHGPANARRDHTQAVLAHHFKAASPPTPPRKSRSNAVRKTPGYDAYVEYIGTSPDINAKNANGPAGRRRTLRAEPPQRYVTVDVFDMLQELVRATRLAAAVAYVQTKDFWGAKAKLDRAKQGTAPEDMDLEMATMRGLTAKSKREIRGSCPQAIRGRSPPWEGLKDLGRRWRQFMHWFSTRRLRQGSMRLTQRARTLTRQLACRARRGKSGGGHDASPRPEEHQGGASADDLSLDLFSSVSGTMGMAAPFAMTTSVAGGVSLADSVEGPSALLAAAAVAIAPAATKAAAGFDMAAGGASSPLPTTYRREAQRTTTTTTRLEDTLQSTMGGTQTIASELYESLVSEPPISLVDPATEVTRKKLRAAKRRRRRTWDLDRPGVSVLTAERLKPKKHGSMQQWMTRTIKEKQDTIKEQGIVRGLGSVLTMGGMSTQARKMVGDFYLQEQRNTDLVMKQERTFGFTGSAEMADFNAEDFAEAASAGNFEYLSVMLTYRRRHDLVAKYVPIDSRTASGYTAFHAAFCQVLAAEQAEVDARRRAAKQREEEAEEKRKRKQRKKYNNTTGSACSLLGHEKEEEEDKTEEDAVGVAGGGRQKTTAKQHSSVSFGDVSLDNDHKTVNFLQTSLLEEEHDKDNVHHDNNSKGERKQDLTAKATRSNHKNSGQVKREDGDMVLDQKARVTANMAEYERVLTLLLHHGAKINCFPVGKPLVDCLTPLHDATRLSNHYRMDYLLKRGADVNLPTTLDTTTALMMAAMGGRSETLAILMANKADLDRVDAKGCCALHHAARGGHMHAVRTLLLAGANWALVNKDGHTPAQEAKNNEQLDAYSTIQSFETGTYRPGRLLDHLALVHEIKTGDKLAAHSGTNLLSKKQKSMLHKVVKMKAAPTATTMSLTATQALGTTQAVGENGVDDQEGGATIRLDGGTVNMIGDDDDDKDKTRNRARQAG